MKGTYSACTDPFKGKIRQASSLTTYYDVGEKVIRVKKKNNSATTSDI